MRNVVLVIGPPCAGKTTWVKRHAGPGDLVIDWDELAVEAGSPATHDHHPDYAAAATRQRRHLEHQVARMTEGTAYVIRAGINPRDVNRIAEQLNATAIKTIDPGYDVVIRRAIEAGRSREAQAAIRDWYAMRRHGRT